MMMSLTLLPKSLAPVLIVIFTVFTVSLVENLEIADGFLTESTEGWKYELSPGESQVGTWTLINTDENPLNLKFRAEGQGSEFFVFEEIATIPPGKQTIFEFIVTIPDNHPDNIEYHPQLFALELGEAPEGGAAVVVFNYEMVANPRIYIGDNPVFTPEPEPVVVEEEPIEESVSDEELTFEAVEEKPMETVEEKLARINEANKAKGQVTPTPFGYDVDDQWEEEAVPELQVDDSYIEEPTLSTEESVPHPGLGMMNKEAGEKVECGFIDWLFSLFGMAKC